MLIIAFLGGLALCLSVAALIMAVLYYADAGILQIKKKNNTKNK